jgi:hypothetical protein
LFEQPSIRGINFIASFRRLCTSCLDEAEALLRFFMEPLHDLKMLAKGLMAVDLIGFEFEFVANIVSPSRGAFAASTRSWTLGKLSFSNIIMH